MTKLRDEIESYCEKQGVDIPPGFRRHSPSRFVIISKPSPDASWKLVARTWFAVADVIDYLDNLSNTHAFRILDFKDGFVVERQGARLKQVSPIEDSKLD